MNCGVSRVAGAFAVALLAACTSLPKAPPSSDSISGRLSVRVEDEQPRSVSAAFELRGSAEAGQLDLNSPLGNVMARASWTPGEVLLVTPDSSARYDNLDTLGRQVLGESLPMAALFDWLRGRPWPGAPSSTVDGGSGFTQLGWTVNVARFAEGLVTATRETPPPVTVRARIER